VRLRELSRAHEDLTGEVNVLGNRLREQLHRDFLQSLDRWLWDLAGHALGEAPSEA